MLPELRQKYDTAQTRKGEFLARIGQATPQQRLFKPQPDAWNMLQVAEHLLMAEKGAYRFTQKYPPMSPTTVQVIWAKVRSATLGAALKLPLKFKAPPQAKPPETPRDFDSILADWDQIRGLWRDYLENCGQTQAKQWVFNHPVAGKLDVAQTFDFFVEHLDHHLPQLKRIMASGGFEAA